jgi:hypothetical protein
MCQNDYNRAGERNLSSVPENNAPATKQDLRELEERLTEAMRDMQTEVLRAFHNWARPTDVKLRSHEERIALLEERVHDIERGKHP